MKLIPNIGPARRTLYVLAGLGFITLALLAPLERPWRLIVVVLGAVTILEGAVGF